MIHFLLLTVAYVVFLKARRVITAQSPLELREVAKLQPTPASLAWAVDSYLTFSDRWRTSKRNDALWAMVYLFLEQQAVNPPIYGEPHFLPIVWVLLRSAIVLSACMSNSHSSVNLMSCHLWKELRLAACVFTLWGSVLWMSWRRKQGWKRPQISTGPSLLLDKTAVGVLSASFGC